MPAYLLSRPARCAPAVRAAGSCYTNSAPRTASATQMRQARRRDRYGGAFKSRGTGWRRGLKNGVEWLSLSAGNAARALEEECRHRSMLSPGIGMSTSHGFMLALWAS